MLPTTRKSTFGLTHYLAMFGAFMVFMQAWTWIGWVIGGPHSVTQYKTPGSLNWWAAKCFEVSYGILFTILLIWVVRRCVRERKLLFDAKLMIAGLSLIWLDSWTNFVAPLFMYSSNFINLNNPLAGFPLAINPDMGRMPFPFVLHLFLYPSLLSSALVVCFVMRKLLAWRPEQSMARLLLTVFAIGVAFDIAFETPIYLLHLWAYPGTPDAFSLFADTSAKFSIWEMIPAGLAYAAYGALRFFKDDKGLELTERGLEGMSSGKRNLVSTLALIAVLSFVWLVATTTQAVVGFYADPYKPLPKYLINDMCDAPVLGGGQVTGTRYGPCPQQGLRYPIRFLPGKAPGSPYGSGPYDTPSTGAPSP